MSFKLTRVKSLKYCCKCLCEILPNQGYNSYIHSKRSSRPVEYFCKNCYEKMFY